MEPTVTITLANYDRLKVKEKIADKSAPYIEIWSYHGVSNYYVHTHDEVIESLKKDIIILQERIKELENIHTETRKKKWYQKFKL